MHEEFLEMLERQKADVPPITLRDQFAMAALTGLADVKTGDDRVTTEVIAKACYMLADAMMEARDK